jgi:L-fuculose-phosphate aldolase
MGKYDKEKKDVLKGARWLSDHGYFASQRGTGGNVSTINKKDNLVLMSPGNRPYHDLSVDDICAVDMDLKNISVSEPFRIEEAMHVSVYHQRPDATAVIHTYSAYASVFSVLNKPIPALFDEITYEIGPFVDVVPYAMWGSSEMIENVSNKLHNKCYCYILQNHGALCLGSKMKQALKNAELLERVSQIYYHTLTTGLEITRLPESSVQQIIEMRKLK